MNAFQKVVLAFACLAGAANIASANTLLIPPVPEIAAKAYLLTDYYSGQTLASLDETKRIEPASLTKLMTAYLTFKAIKQGSLKLDQVVPVSNAAYKKEGSVMFIDPKIPVTVNELIHGMIIQSGNDACIALSEAIAGSEDVFAQLMNKEAQRLGMANTHFMNSTGLPHPEHYTTARDLGILARAIIHDFPEFYPIYSQKEYTYNKIKQPNRNLLLWRDPNVDGMKTGHTDSAGFCLIASAKRDGRRVISVVLGAANENVRATESAKLLNWGLQFYETPKLYAANQPLQQIQVWKGETEKVGVGFRGDLYMSLPKGAASRIKATITTQQPLVAPLSAGQRVGKISLTLDGKTIGEYPVVALSNVPQAGFVGRTWDSLRLMFK
ncbi:D-alanyl-D-alanine carboxypeptidase (penicillin-binding protein 5/6) [Chitinivorax tropicus]|uniref:serine-type D-Ala-D-Ala carboxypeptidase n=1 Tax=Chitinivorax tropicus TaxID=714531 RepID=A0A840MUG2_9PROT|nr:D-alanyl-D-alanine carboxypeptidase family protein [Chitinivorax tropicus]MBB5019963.1 D-alanyl-D-alanine carboxypeptidase (penicillin-binding protein 5/6) [Chitinivorax tropicus]